MKKPEVLYHYTSVEAFCAIVKSGRLWASSAAFLNDVQELKFSIARAEERWRVGKADPYGNVIDLARDEVPKVYIASFSELDDDLSQWRAYGRPAGICIGIRREVLQAQVPNDYVLEESVFECIYDDDVLNAALDKLRESMDEFDPEESTYPDAAPEAFAEELLALAARFKHSRFQAEFEWRAVLNEFAWKKGSLKRGAHIAHGLLVPHLELELKTSERHWLASVRIGPCPNRELAREGVRQFLRTENTALPQEIQMSEIPFRDW